MAVYAVSMKTSDSSFQRWFANGALLLVTFIWGSTFTLTKNALMTVPVFHFLSVRFCIAALMLMLMSLLSPTTRNSFQKKTIWLGTGLGLVLFAAYAFQTIGLQYTTASAAGFLTGLSVVLVPILGLPLLRIMPHRRSWAGAGIAVIGLACLCGLDLVHLAVGNVLVLFCAVFIAAQMLLIEKYGREESSLALATVEIVVLAICCSLVSLLRIEPMPGLHLWLQPSVMWAVLICAIPGTAFAYWAQNVFQKFTSSAQTAIIFSMEPVFAAVIAWVYLHDTLSRLAILGCLLIFVGMLVADSNFRWKRLGRHLR
jgi:drug/metabolite transporter (DMT)-like permease